MNRTRRELLVISGLAAGSLSGLLWQADSSGNESNGSNESENATDDIDDGAVADDAEIDEIQTTTELSLDFRDWTWVGQFTDREFVGHVDLVTEEAYGERSLRVDIPEGESDGTSLHYWFAEESTEPEELWASYYVYFPESFEATDQVGKLPGPAGTYGNGGWGGRRSDGTNGWSARMGFKGDGSDEIGIQYYVYHAAMDDNYGDFFVWDKNVSKGEWHRIDQYILLNDPGRADGVLMGWVDGEEAYNHRDIRFRDTDELKIEDYWFNVYWGGMYDSPQDNRILFDDLTVRTNAADDSGDSSDAENNSTETDGGNDDEENGSGE